MQLEGIAMRFIVNITSNPAVGGLLRRVPNAMNKHSSRATLPLWTLLLALGVAAGERAHGADQFTYTYDALGRLHSVTYQNGTAVTYTYDPAGNRTQVTNTPGSGSTRTPPTPQQRRKAAALQAILSILLGN
jgi:YD repeat-containing protein